MVVDEYDGRCLDVGSTPTGSIISPLSEMVEGFFFNVLSMIMGEVDVCTLRNKDRL